MKNIILAIVLFSSLFLTACNSSDNSKDGGASPKDLGRIDWNSIPSEFNPRVEDFNFRTDGAEQMSVDVFGFSKDFEIVYADMPANTSILRMFTVSKDSSGSMNLNPKKTGKKLDLNASGSYQCSIKTTNGRIESLKGKCYIRMQLFLPAGAEIEVYNSGNLLSRRFFAMSNEDFLKKIDDAYSSNKQTVIDEYLNSYVETRKTPALSANQLGLVVNEFSFKEDKMTALRKLQAYAVDRENLRAMIEERFSYFDREEARRICGL